MAHMLDWPMGPGVLLLLHPQQQFSRSDAITIPPKKAAILEQDAAFSPVYREGEAPVLGKGLLRRVGKLYLMDLCATPLVGWGCPDIVYGDRRGGCFGKISLRVVSPLRFVEAYRGKDLPLAAERLIEALMPRLQGIIRRETLALGKREAMPAAQLCPLIAQAVIEHSEDDLEDQGLAIEQMVVEDLFFPD